MPGPHVYGDQLPAGRLSPSGPAGHLPLRGGWRNSAWGGEKLPGGAYFPYTATAPGQLSPASALPASPSAP